MKHSKAVPICFPKRYKASGIFHSSGVQTGVAAEIRYPETKRRNAYAWEAHDGYNQ